MTNAGGVRPMHTMDLDALVPLHQASFANTPGVALGEGYVRAFLQWFIAYTEAVRLVYEEEGTLCGYVFGASAGYAHQLNHDLLDTILWSVLTHPWIVLRYRFLRQIPGRFRSFSRKPAPPSTSNEAIYKLVGIGVNPTMRHRGIGRQLIVAFEEAVWDVGYNEIQLSVYDDNLKARKLYESCGWELFKERGESLTYVRRRKTN